MYTWCKIKAYSECVYFNSSVHPHSWCNGDENFKGGDLMPVTMIFRVTKVGKNTTQKIHTHKKNHTIHYTWGHTQSHGHKPTLLTIIQLLPGTTVISHIILLESYFLSLGPLYSFPAGIWNQFSSTLKPVRKP